MIKKSSKLNNIFYDIRGPVLKEARRLEEEGHQILKLNIGNPAPFGFNMPESMCRDLVLNLPQAQGYSDSHGLFHARRAVANYYETLGVKQLHIDHIWLGNGVSELIVMAMQALLDHGEEVLIPSPDYPLWTGAVSLSGGTPVHYRCQAETDWQPDLDEIKRKITPRTKAIVIINPNNPTGAVYSQETLFEICQIAAHHGLLLLADEIYDKVLYDDAKHHTVASISQDILSLTFGGLSKNYRAAGLRGGWMVLNGPKKQAEDYIEGLNLLSSMRLCANVPAQTVIQTALGGYQSINHLVQADGRLLEQRNIAWQMLNQISGLTCFKAKGAMYLFFRLDPKKYSLKNDEQLVLDLLRQEHILLVQGTAFHWEDPYHFRLVFLPHKDDLIPALEKIERFLHSYRQ